MILIVRNLEMTIRFSLTSDVREKRIVISRFLTPYILIEFKIQIYAHFHMCQLLHFDFVTSRQYSINCKSNHIKISGLILRTVTLELGVYIKLFIVLRQ